MNVLTFVLKYWKLVTDQGQKLKQRAWGMAVRRWVHRTYSWAWNAMRADARVWAMVRRAQMRWEGHQVFGAMIVWQVKVSLIESLTESLCAGEHGTVQGIDDDDNQVDCLLFIPFHFSFHFAHFIFSSFYFIICCLSILIYDSLFVLFQVHRGANQSQNSPSIQQVELQARQSQGTTPAPVARNRPLV